MPAADAEEQAHYLVREPHLPPRSRSWCAAPCSPL